MSEKDAFSSPGFGRPGCSEAKPGSMTVGGVACALDADWDASAARCVVGRKRWGGWRMVEGLKGFEGRVDLKPS